MIFVEASLFSICIAALCACVCVCVCVCACVRMLVSVDPYAIQRQEFSFEFMRSTRVFRVWCGRRWAPALLIAVSRLSMSVH